MCLVLAAAGLAAVPAGARPAGAGGVLRDPDATLTWDASFEDAEPDDAHRGLPLRP